MLERLHNIRVVLARPRFPENIGAAARAVANLGLGGLWVVEPVRLWQEPMRRMATGQGREVLESMQVAGSLQEALAGCVAAVGTTARRGRDRLQLLPPRQAAPEMLQRAAAGPVAVVFGPEDKGLATRELDHCYASLCIPTTADSSLNLAQSVVVVAYELRAAAAEAAEAGQPPAGPGRDQAPAPLEELDALKRRLVRAFIAMGVLPAQNPEHFFRPFKTVLDRARPTRREVRAWHGIARQGLWLSRRAGLEEPGE
jgi:tRNA/rRNA methyltransferase